MLDLTNISHWKAGSIVENIVKVLSKKYSYHIGKMFKVPIPCNEHLRPGSILKLGAQNRPFKILGASCFSTQILLRLI